MTLINIDPNVRLADNQTFAGFEDIKYGQPEVNSLVRVHIEETDLYGIGTVTAIDNEKQLIFIKVNWSEITSFPAPLINHKLAATTDDVDSWGGANLADSSQYSNEGIETEYRNYGHERRERVRRVLYERLHGWIQGRVNAGFEDQLIASVTDAAIAAYEETDND